MHEVSLEEARTWTIHKHVFTPQPCEVRKPNESISINIAVFDVTSQGHLKMKIVTLAESDRNNTNFLECRGCNLLQHS